MTAASPNDRRDSERAWLSAPGSSLGVKAIRMPCLHSADALTRTGKPIWCAPPSTPVILGESKPGTIGMRFVPPDGAPRSLIHDLDRLRAGTYPQKAGASPPGENPRAPRETHTLDAPQCSPFALLPDQASIDNRKRSRSAGPSRMAIVACRRAARHDRDRQILRRSGTPGRGRP